ncbi:MAG: hypothetical protein IT341_11235 [Chloroflexi bacterium]|nr:hypothetical protein [Chloroflexota bacterium]
MRADSAAWPLNGLHWARPGRSAWRLGRRQLVTGLAAATALVDPRLVAGESAPDPHDLASAVLDAVNAFRITQDREPLTLSPGLQAAAQAHADDMARNDFVAHTSSDGTSAVERIRRYYPYNTWLGENVAAGFTNAAAVVAGWQASPRHREGLLMVEFRAAGVGVAVSEQSRYRWFWTCDLGGEQDGV